MFLAAAAPDPIMYIAALIGTAVGAFGWLHFQEEAEAMEGHTVTYPQLAMRLRWEIKEESIQPGQKLPSTRELAERHGAARKTVIRALKMLAAENLIEILPGRGSYVAGGSRTDKPKDTVECHLLNTTRPGHRLPSTEEIRRACGVSHSTARRVIAALLRRGVLYRSRDGIYRR